MEGINTFISIFCVTAIMIGGIKILLGGVLEESGKYILALVLLAVTVAAIANINISFKANKKTTETKSEDYSLSLTAHQAEYAIETLLKENNINFKKIQVSTTKNKEGNIVISEVVVFSAEEKEKIENLIITNKIAQKVIFK